MGGVAACPDASGHSSNLPLRLLRGWRGRSWGPTLADGGVWAFVGDLGADGQHWIGRLSRHAHHVHLGIGKRHGMA